MFAISLQVLTVDLCEASITEIDPALLESPKNTCAGINNFLGAGVFGSCTKMFYRGMPVAVKRFYSASTEDLKREAQIMMTLQHQNIPCLLGISTSSSPKLLVLNDCTVNDKSFTIRTALHSKSLQLSQKECVAFLCSWPKPFHMCTTRDLFIKTLNQVMYLFLIGIMGIMQSRLILESASGQCLPL